MHLSSRALAIWETVLLERSTLGDRTSVLPGNAATRTAVEQPTTTHATNGRIPGDSLFFFYFSTQELSHPATHNPKCASRCSTKDNPNKEATLAQHFTRHARTNAARRSVAASQLYTARISPTKSITRRRLNRLALIRAPHGNRSVPQPYPYQMKLQASSPDESKTRLKWSPFTVESEFETAYGQYRTRMRRLYTLLRASHWMLLSDLIGCGASYGRKKLRAQRTNVQPNTPHTVLAHAPRQAQCIAIVLHNSHQR